MRKDVGLMLAAAVCFDLGIMSVPARAETKLEYLKIESLPVSFNFTKIEVDYVAAANACVQQKGTPVDFKGTKYCRTEKAGTSPSPQRK